jgi:hypothetical protein
MSDQRDNLDFFNAAILLESIPRPNSKVSVSSDFALIEATNSACLGAQIGYFDSHDAFELISNHRLTIFDAWIRLSERQIVLTDYNAFNAVERDPKGVLFIDKEKFSMWPYDGPRDVALNFFRDFLLLTAENILDNNSRYFLDAIEWTSDEEWQSYTRGTPGYGSVQSLAMGFSNVLRFWEAAVFLFNSQLLAMSPSQRQRAESALNELSKSPYLQRIVDEYQLWASVANGVGRIIGPRFNFRSPEVRSRYIVLAGELASRADDGTPEWLDAQRKLFNDLTSLIGSAVGGSERDWTLFAKGLKSKNEAVREATESST